jgi:hypothetical protein
VSALVKVKTCACEVLKALRISGTRRSLPRASAGSLENAMFGEFEIALAGSCVTHRKGYTHWLRKDKAVCVAGGNPAVSLQVLSQD